MDVTYSPLVRRSLAIEVEDNLRKVFLQKRCVICPAVTPACGSCKEDEVCSQIPATCESCAVTSCVKKSLATNTGVSSGGSSGPNVGGIAGGVVGGVAMIALITFLVYWFAIKGKRRQQDYDAKTWEEEAWEPEKPPSEFSVQRDVRSSTHTVTSMASTVLTRASNVIQIAYIPGVTNRNPNTPGVLVPPVPPIPLALSPDPQGNGQYVQGHPDTLYFDANDIRDSTYSGLSTIDGRTSYARTSMAPSISPSLARTSMAPSISPSLARSSVATTIFRGNAVASPVPALPIMRGKAAVVSVKSNNSGSPNQSPEIETPPIPSIDFSKHTPPQSAQPKLVKMPSTGSGSIRSTATLGRPVPVSIVRGKPSAVSTSSSSSKPSPPPSPTSSPKGLGLHRLTEVSISSNKTHERAEQSPHQSEHSLPSSDEESDGEPHARSRQSLLNKSGTAAGKGKKHAVPKSMFASPAFTEMENSPQEGQSPFVDNKKEKGPFGDEHVV